MRPIRVPTEGGTRPLIRDWEIAVTFPRNREFHSRWEIGVTFPCNREFHSRLGNRGYIKPQRNTQYVIRNTQYAIRNMCYFRSGRNDD